MSDVRLRSVSKGVAVALLALVPAYCSMEGLLTGDTPAIDRRTHSHGGMAGVLTAVAYGLLAAALVIAAIGHFTADSRPRAALFKWAWNVAIVGAVLFFSGRLAWLLL